MTQMFGVSGQWNAALAIGGKDYVINPTTVQELNWFETIHQNLPTLSLSLMDTDGTFATIAGAGDGVPIDLTLGDGGYSGETTSKFNIIGQPQLSHGSGYTLIKINAVLDALPYMRKIVAGHYKGSSSSVIGQIASQNGLTFDGDVTADEMTWLPNNKTLASFVRHVANHGWVGVGSCMIAAVTSDKKLVYRNIAQPQNSGEHFGVNDGDTQMVDWSASSNSMVTNNNRGYGSTSFGFDEAGLVKELTKITFNMFSNFLPVSTANINSLGELGGRLDNLIRSAGNTHAKYDDAAHQNKRMRAIYSSDLNVVTAQVSKTELLKEVTASPIDFTTLQPNVSLAGPYIVTARTRSLLRSKYVERVTLTTSGSS